MVELRELERIHASLQLSGSLLQTGNCQVISHAQILFVMAVVHPPMSHPGAFWTLVTRFSVGSKAATLAHKTEGRKGRQPVKPLRRIGQEREFSLLRADDHIGVMSPIFDQWMHTSACAQLRWVETSPWTCRAILLASTCCLSNRAIASKWEVVK